MDQNTALLSDPSKKLSKAWNRRYDLANTRFAGFLARIGKDLAADRLHLSHAEAKAHKPPGKTHETAIQPFSFITLNGCIRSHSRAWQSREQSIDLVLGTFFSKKRQNHPHGLLGDRWVNAGVSGNAGDQIIHMKPRRCSRIDRT
jgi:hypothetical protein